MDKTVVAKLPQGEVIGSREGAVCRFSAIPYAQPPVGPLRFCPPQAPAWTGPLDARQPGPIPPQLPSRLREAAGDFDVPQSEDCLHLTVWTPAPDRARRPVLVWLHGGAWQSGAGALDWYSGAPLAARGDIVVVAPNYRLGALGWIAVAGETANVGLLDQEAAIDWVVRHIEALGGDPHNITVMGQSAGSMSIACLLMRQPRFQRAILQSASLGRGFRSRDKADEIARIYLRAAGAAHLDQARDLPVQALLQAQQAAPVLRWLASEGAHRSLFAPVADGQVLPLQPEVALADAAARIDVIAGHTHDEMAAFPGGGTDPQSQALGDQIYGAFTRQWAADATARGRQAWCYRFDHRPNPTFGACHCIELPFVFGTQAAFADAPMLHGLQAPEARRLTDELQSHWLAFVRDGHPGWAPWPQQKIFS